MSSQEFKGIVNHVGIIPDGIRRWSKIHNIPLLEAYLYGIKKLSKFTSMLFENGVKTISIFGSSIQNFKRSEPEVEAFCKAENIFCSDYLPGIAQRYNTKVVSVGRNEVLPLYFQNELKRIESSTVNYNQTKLYLLVAYDPAEEIRKAFLAANPDENFLDFLSVSEPVDLVFRTSGANLFSNFLPLQSGSARLYILNKLFNDTTPKDYQKILVHFKGLHRLYGE